MKRTIKILNKFESVSISSWGNYIGAGGVYAAVTGRAYLFYHARPIPTSIGFLLGGDDDDDAAIPFGNYYLVIVSIAVVSLIIIMRRKVNLNKK